MPTISDFKYGYDSNGLDTYLKEIKSEYLDKAKEALLDISEIKTCCENEWEGKARDAFIYNLGIDSEHVADQFDTLYGILVKEISSINAAMANKDEVLIEKGW